MLDVSYSSQFKKDLKRELKDPGNKVLPKLLDYFLSLLLVGEELPKEFHEHQLTGNYKGHFEAHLKPDLLIIYKFDLYYGVILIRLGSHADLF